MSSINFNPEKDIQSQAGKVILITGGTAGLGAGSIHALAKHQPAQIIFSGRNEKSAKALIDEVRTQSPDVKLTFVRCDISSLSSVQECAATVKATTDRLDIFMLNAGIMATPPSTSVDGYEIQWATNHLGHSLLVKLLLPLMQQTAKLPGADVRVINMTSIAYQQAPSQGIDFATLKSSQANLGILNKWARYGQSKLAQMLYTDELASHYPEITWVSIHPGVILTGLFENTTFLTRLPVLILNIGKTTPVEKGHFAQCWAATAPNVVNGMYYEPIGIKAKRTTAQSKDKKLSGKLWEWTETELAKWA